MDSERIAARVCLQSPASIMVLISVVILRPFESRLASRPGTLELLPESPDSLNDNYTVHQWEEYSLIAKESGVIGRGGTLRGFLRVVCYVKKIVIGSQEVIWGGKTG